MTIKKLKNLINRAVKASNAAHEAQENLNNYCEEIYGFVPGDMDLDEIIDACYGGCGISNGMKAIEFDAIMRSRAK